MDKKIEKKIAKLKKEAERYYLGYYAIADEYDCSLNLSEYLCQRMMDCKEDFNRTMDELALLDPTTPKGRL